MNLLLLPLLIASAAASPRLDSRISSGVYSDTWTNKCYVQIVTTFGLTSTTKYCGGCLVAPGDRIITAASCVSNNGDVNPKYIKIVQSPSAAMFTYSQLMSTGPQIKSVHLHPNFKIDQLYSGSDIAVIMLKSTPTTSIYFAPAVLGTETAADAYLEQSLNACGHGITDDKRAPPFSLQCTTLKVVKQADCIAAFPPNSAPNPALDKFICTKNSDDKNVCYGDNGAPVFTVAGSVQKVYGIVSLFPNVNATSVCKGRHFAVHTQVGAFADFINKPI